LPLYAAASFDITRFYAPRTPLRYRFDAACLPPRYAATLMAPLTLCRRRHLFDAAL